ncbi:MAG: hypothetical protein HY978_01390 [Candidatus Liptonbacteria bacterium]|nr:hypothetical protein [Candidatus Liptonbacteria bacterium]
MINLEAFVQKLIALMGFEDCKIEVDAEHRHGSIFIYSHENLIQENLPDLVESINHLVQMAAKQQNAETIFFDLNNYRRERERLIAELARTAARKVLATQQELTLPSMNSYERRLVHVELATHPGVVTESNGVGRERCVVIKPLTDEPKGSLVQSQTV